MTTPGSAGEVFAVFAKLGLTSFGGPIAHLGYFRDELVTRRRWLDDERYADLVALCQFLPGPASSQVGFALGMLRAGVGGAFAAFLAFTLPSAVFMIAVAYGADLLGGPIGGGIVEGLKIVAVAIVAQAVWGMARSLTPDRQRAAIAAGAAVIALLLFGTLGQILAIVLGALAGLWLCRSTAENTTEGMLRFPVSRLAGWVCLGAWVLLLLALPILAAVTGSGAVSLLDAFYRAGALVFGGGHVVLPLLDAGVVDTGWLTPEQFLTGYGAVQATPGPLFTFAGYLGALADVGPGGVVGGAIALLGIFLPGFLLLVGMMPFWNVVRARPWAGATLRGASAAVVGILAAALYDPVFVSAIVDGWAFALALVCFVLLVSWRVAPWIVVLVGAAGGVLLAFV